MTESDQARGPSGSARADGPGEGEQSAQADGARLLREAVSLVDSLFDYAAARFHLEGHRLESRGRAFLARAILMLAAVAVALLGLGFASAGVATLISEKLDSRPAGMIIVGAFYLLAGVVAVIAAARRRT